MTEKELISRINKLDEERASLAGQLSVLLEAKSERLASQQLANGRTNACSSYWRDDDTCNFCGSITLEHAVRLLETPGTQYSGSDWKYGWPHKFYIGSKKFYSSHLLDAPPALFDKFRALSEKFFDIEWTISDGCKLTYKAVYGVQRYGVVPLSTS